MLTRINNLPHPYGKMTRDEPSFNFMRTSSQLYINYGTPAMELSRSLSRLQSMVYMLLLWFSHHIDCFSRRFPTNNHKHDPSVSSKPWGSRDSSDPRSTSSIWYVDLLHCISEILSPKTCRWFTTGTAQVKIETGHSRKFIPSRCYWRSYRTDQTRYCLLNCHRFRGL